MDQRNIFLPRREFLKAAGSAATATAAFGAMRGVSLVLDSKGTVEGSPAARWAMKELNTALSVRGVAVRSCERISEAASTDLCVVAAGSNTPIAGDVLTAARIRVSATAEALALASGKVDDKQVVLAAGHDVRGLVYALLELKDRVEYHDDPLAALSITKAVAEQPANKLRGINRLFTSDVEDLGWFNDREMWSQYLTMLATQRFNRFHLALGIGYDFLRNVTDAYFLFPYPFLFAVPGYNVRVPQISDTERDRNLEMLKFISEQTVARGMEFQMGLWMHGYEWLESPNPKHTIEGLTKDTHGPYCRDAVRMLLKACPAISGVTFRVHGESGVEEGSYDFWRTVFDGVKTCGRTVEIDMHSKGMDQTMLDMAVQTGMPVKLSPKYWAEHMGMPYHQADIRELERPNPNRQASGLMKFSAGSRSFLRYGYGDLLRENRKWDVWHRIWPGTQRLLLWGDPVTAAAHAKAFQFCGSVGVDVMEPLSFKGRRGSGIAGDRCAYADSSLSPRWDWQKYLYSFRVWGRNLYNPEADPDSWRRGLNRDFGPAAQATEAALSNCSRILPIVTTTHGASAGNNTYWPEVYTNLSMVDATKAGPYTDTPAPRVFGNVTPMDPQLFSRINDFADEMLKGERSGKYSPIEVAQWIEDYSATAAKHLAQARAQAMNKGRREYRRMDVDVSIQCGLGRFYGAKFRSGVLYRIFEATGDKTALEESLKQYRVARSAWAELANTGKVYKLDITVGERQHLRGHWLDRLPAIDADITAVEAKLASAKAGKPEARVAAAIREALGRPQREKLNATHTPPTSFRQGEALALTFLPEKKPVSVRLCYRHVTQAERYEQAEMELDNNRYRATIPAAYTSAEYPLQYYFEVRISAEKAVLFPGFNAELTNQPYYTVRKA